jgi:hypothetical protein
MKYEIKNFENKDTKKLIGFIVKDDKNATFAIDKYLPLVSGKTNEDYIKEALDLCKDEIDEWQSSFALVGRSWNPITNSFE